MISIDIARLIELLLPPAMRGQVHIAFLRSLLAPAISEWQEYLAWRDELWYKSHVTAQTISMQAYLNRIFDPLLKRVKISHGETKRVYISLWSEPAGPYIPADDGVFIGLEGEESEINASGFIVEIPPGINQLQVAGVVDSIKAAGISYEIKVNTR